MKRNFYFVVVLCGLGCIISCKSLDYPQPIFDRPSSFVIDTFEVSGGLEDRIRLYNQTSYINISFTVYVHEPEKNVWLEYGTGALKGTGDTEFISSRLAGKLDNYRYFAIEALDGYDYTYNFYKKSNDLHIIISDYKEPLYDTEFI